MTSDNVCLLLLGLILIISSHIMLNSARKEIERCCMDSGEFMLNMFMHGFGYMLVFSSLIKSYNILKIILFN